MRAVKFQGLVLRPSCAVPNGPKYQDMGHICDVYARNRHTGFGNVLCIWVLGPLGC